MIDALEAAISEIEQWRKENWMEKVGTAPFTRTTVVHQALVSLRDADGGTPEQRAEVLRRMSAA